MTLTQADKKNKIAILHGRKTHLAYQGVSEKQLWRVYRKAAGKIGTKIMMAETPIQKAKLRALLNSVEGEVKRLDSKVLSSITTSINKSVKMGLDNSIDRLSVYNGFLPATFSIELTSSVFNSIYHDAVRALYRRPLDGIELSERVWDIHQTSITKIRRLIAKGFLYGEPQYSIAQQVRRMLLISDSDMRTKKWKEFFKLNPPGRGVYRSAYKNTQRVMRTETNNAFRTAQSEYAKNRSWIIGEKWNRVAGALECGECDTYATQDLYGLGSGVYPGGEIPISHPQCLCFLTDIIKRDIFKSGASVKVI